MSDLFKKLNVLVKAAINDALGDESTRSSTASTGRQKLGGGIEREVGLLRQRINEALSYEDDLKKRVATLQAEVNKWDQQADEAVAAGNDANARYAVEQMQRAQRSQTMAESDLREHQLVTQELISRVNELDAAVADAKRAQTDDEAPETAPAPGQLLSDALKDVREKVSRITDELRPVQPAAVASPEPEAQEPVDPQEIDDDLAKRLQRLSKPEK